MLAFKEINMRCYCANEKSFDNCCKPFISGAKTAETAEQLMRSRYSAYAINDAQYLYQTYAPEAQVNHTVEEIAKWAQQTHWLKLEVLAQQLIDNTHAWVEFKAYYLHQQQYLMMHEKSYFALYHDQWRYQTGDIIEHQLLKKLKRNDLCPCNSGKKFKKCCG